MPAAAPTLTVRDLFSQEQLARSGDFTRAITLDRGGIDVEKRTAALSFSSEAAVMRYDMRGQPFYEVLDHGSVDMSRMQPGAPLLYGHDRRDHIGTVLEAGIGPDKRGRAVVKFSRGKFAQEKFDDVQDGILHSSSVGYDLSNAEPVADGERDGIPVYRFRQWLPFEVTLCAIPADTSVGVGRSKPETPAAIPAATPTKRSTSMSETTSAAPAAVAATVTADYTAERQRIKDLNATARVLAEKHPQHAEAFRSLASKCSETGDTVDAFNRAALNDILSTKADLAPVTQGRAELGLNGKEIKRYSLLGAITRKLNNQPLEGLEREAHEAEEKRVGRSAAGFFVPAEVLYSGRQASINYARELNATGASSAGGYTIPEVIDSNFIELLRNATKVVGLGARVITGLQGNISIPRVLSGTTASWLSESGAVTASTPTFGQIAMKPRRLASLSAYTKQFLAQTSISAEAFVRDDIFRSQAVELDRVAIAGAGGAEPLGILNLASGDRSTSITFSGAATWAKYVEFFVNVLTNNALLGSPAFLTTPATMGKGMTITKFANTGMPIWADNNTIGGYRAEVTNQFPTSGTLNQVIFGDFSQVVYGQWVGNDVTVDPYTLLTTGQIRISVENLMDMVVRQGKAFAISSDTGAA